MDTRSLNSIEYMAVPVDEKDEQKNGKGQKKKSVPLKEIKSRNLNGVGHLTKEELIFKTDKLFNGTYEADSAIKKTKKDELLKDWENWLLNDDTYCYMFNIEEIKDEILKLIPQNKFKIIDSLLTSIAEVEDEKFVEYLNQLSSQKVLRKKIFQQLMFHEYTLLQAVSKHGMYYSVQKLLELKFNINQNPIIPHKPIQLACKYGHPEILKLLIDHEDEEFRIGQLKSIRNGRNLFHQTVRSLAPFDRSHKCLKILLKQTTENNEPLIDINEQDKLGRTPLHYAVMHKNELCVLKLLKNGARIDIKDHLKQTPLSSMTEDAFRKYFDSMVSFKTYDKKAKKDKLLKNDKDNDYDLEFDFKNIFRKDNKGNHYFKMDLLKKIKRESRLKKLIAHPIISIIIYFEWYRIRLCFYFYVIFYILFTMLYTTYIILDEKPENSTEISNSTGQNSTEPNFWESNFPSFPDLLLILSAIILFIFTLLEIIKMTGEHWLKLQYVKSLDNLIRCITFGNTWAVVILNGVSDSEFIRLKAISILFVWFELFLVFAKYPPLTYHIITFRSASIRLLKFLFVHSILLLGFAFAFHVLFRKSEAMIFHNPGKAVFKTLIMLTSEFDAGDIPFDNYSGVSHIIFIFYIFVVTIVLFNLMIALALSKVNDMEKNPLLYRSFTEIDMIVHFERYYLESQNAIHTKIQKFIFSIFNFFSKGIQRVTCQDLRPCKDLDSLIITMKENKMQQFIIFETYPERVIKFVKLNDYIESRIFSKIHSWLHKNELDHKIVNNAWEIATRRLTERQSKTNQMAQIKNNKNYV